MRRFMPIALVLALWPGVIAAQVPDWVTQILNAAQLPVSAAQARTEGVADTTIRTVLEAMRTANMPAHEAKDMLDTARAMHREHGPVDNFGAFVQSKLQAGLRGRELAAAIKAEHRARGKGKAAGATGRGAAGEKGRAPGDSARAGQKGRPDRPAGEGKQPGKGRPDTPSR